MDARQRWYQTEMNLVKWAPGMFIGEDGMRYWWEQLRGALAVTPYEAIIARNTTHMTTHVIRHVMSLRPLS